MDKLLPTFETLEDVLLDDSFRKWVIKKEDDAALLWHKRLQQYPEKKGLFNIAFHILENLYMKHQHISEEEVQKEIAKILLKIKAEDTVAETIPKASIISSLFKHWKAVAAAVIIVTSGLFIYNRNQSKVPNSYQAFLQKASVGSKEYINNGDSLQIISLSDGSTVMLYAKTKLVFSISNSKREAYMDGKAFFQVKKDAAQPFIVYTKKIVTKVLGTSFYVDAYQQNEAVRVTVKTGKVSVYKGEDFTEKSALPNQLEGTLVTPNQQVVLAGSKNNLVRSLVDDPVILDKTEDIRFKFEATPVREVFAQIQKQYGIPILFDEAIFAACSLTAVFENESFYDKLNIIVKAINATYKLVDGNIVISSDGCK